MEESRKPSVADTDARIPERKLIEAAQAGDKKAFGQLIRLHQKKLFRFVYGLTGSFDVAEDVVQDTFIKAYEALGRFNTAYAFYPWLSTIARNTAYNQIRRDEKQESLDNLSDKGYDQASGELGPLDQLLDSEGKKRFYQALNKLPLKYRTVFVLRHFEGMDYARIASYLKIPPGTVDSRLHRARNMIMDELSDLL